MRNTLVPFVVFVVLGSGEKFHPETFHLLSDKMIDYINTLNTTWKVRLQLYRLILSFLPAGTMAGLTTAGVTKPYSKSRGRLQRTGRQAHRNLIENAPALRRRPMGLESRRSSIFWSVRSRPSLMGTRVEWTPVQAKTPIFLRRCGYRVGCLYGDSRCHCYE